MTFKTLLTTSVFAGGISFLSGAVSFTEDFSAGGAPGSASNSGFFMDIANWGESDGVIGTGTAFREFIGGTATPGFAPVGGAGFTPGVSSAGFIYSLIGTRGADTTLNVSGVNYSRVFGTGGQQNTLIMQVYSLPATSSFTFAEFGNDIATAVGVNLVGAFTAAAPPANSGTALPFATSFDISGIGATDPIYLRFTSGAGTLPAYVDNIVATSVPEPSAFLLLGAGCLGAFVRRRRA